MPVHIPFDLISEKILPRIPVKSLLRFTSVCKKWLRFIKSRQFIQAHLHHNRFEANGNLEFLLIYNHNSFYVLDENQEPDLFVKFDFSFYDFEPSSDLHIGSCNGLILINLHGSAREGVLLWNPSIRRIKLLANKRCCLLTYRVFGLGFHELSEQHRVVKIKYKYADGVADSTVITTVKTYSCSSNSWHKVNSKPSKIISTRVGGVYLNGCVHWMVVSNNVYSTTLFDFENNCFGELDLPEEVNDKNVYSKVVKEFQGSLAIVYFNRDDEDDGCTVWNMIQMTEYGVFESWTKKFKVFLPENYVFYYNVLDSFTKNGTLVYEEEVCGTSCLNFMDVQTYQSKYVKGFEDQVIVTDYMESLALLC